MTFNRTMAALAFVLAAGALIVRSPEGSRENDAAALAAQIEAEQDHIEPIELAKLIKEGKAKIELVDLRDSAAYARYHIPGARLMTLTMLVSGRVQRNEDIVIYSEGGTHAAQAWVLLKEKNYPKVRTLLGGMSGWEDEILYPKLAFGSDENEKRKSEERKELSIFFGGEPHLESAPPGRTIQKEPPPKQIVPPAKFEKEEDKLRQTC